MKREMWMESLGGRADMTVESLGGRADITEPFKRARKMTKPRLTPWLATSLILSAASFLSFCSGMDPGQAGWTKTAHAASWITASSLGLGAVWVGMLIGARIVLGRRGLWLLVGIPGVLVGPVYLAVFFIPSIAKCMAVNLSIYCLP